MAIIWLFSSVLLFLLFLSKSCSELITNLPGQLSNVSFKQYSGYIVTDAKQGRALFYYFVEADVSDPLSCPLTLWLNGGPGCSSLGFGAFMEHGPFQPGKNGFLVKNQYSWNLESNMLYVESPIGVGFSYSNTSSNYQVWNDTTTGHYIPQLAALIMQYNKQSNNKAINLKAIALGNPLLDLDISVQAGEYLWAHGAISDETLMLEKTTCNDSKYIREYAYDVLSESCNDVFKRVADEISNDVPRTDLLSLICFSATSMEQFRPKKKQYGKIQSIVARRDSQQRGDPCLGDRIFTYLNNPQVQKALHANTTHLPYHWDFYYGPLVYQEDNLDMNLIPLISDLLKEGIPVLLYSGDQDTKIPLTQTRIIANNLAKELKLVPLAKYGTWYDKKQVAGWSQSFGEVKEGKNKTYLTFATVRGGAHEVPFTSPSQSLTLFRSFLTAFPLPRPN